MGESGLFLTPVLTLWGDGHIDQQVWRWVIVPPDLVRSFGMICTQYRYRVIHCTITLCLRDLSPREKGNSRLTKLLDGLSYEKIQRYNNSPPYVTARWPPQQIPPLNFLVKNSKTQYHVQMVNSFKCRKWTKMSFLFILKFLCILNITDGLFLRHWVLNGRKW